MSNSPKANKQQQKSPSRSTPTKQPSSPKKTSQSLIHTPTVEPEVEDGSPKLLGILPSHGLLGYILALGKLVLLGFILFRAYDIRTIAIQKYGRVIHEYDPWFNYRATEYLEKEGWTKFFTWFDYMSWYPLGRPVGTTIYPGMQITSVLIYRALNWLSENVVYLKGVGMSLNDVCVFVPAWFGVVATSFLALLTYECSGSSNSAVIAAAIMAIIPSHIMRSVGGGYDNESIAMTAMMATFYFWCRSLRTENSWPIGIATGLAYAYMVAVWGGFIFVLNMVGLHAGFLLLTNLIRGHHSTPLYKAYSLFFIIGTFGATRVPVVGWMPFKSLEQLAPFALFLVFQLLQFCHNVSASRGYKANSWQDIRFKLFIFSIATAILAAVVMHLLPTGFFGPLSARVRGLFLKHTRTGNPLVDSVAEHQPVSEKAFHTYLHYTIYLAPVGLFLLSLNFYKWRQSSFLALYGITAYMFCLKMSRLILLAGPAASAFSGIALGYVSDWIVDQLEVRHSTQTTQTTTLDKIRRFYRKIYPIRLILAFVIFAALAYHTEYAIQFQNHANVLAPSLSEPRIMFQHTFENGRVETIMDYMDAYNFLKKNTPTSARVMAWWDYGYQITGIGHRTTIADGNTWNHEHIATLGYMLSGPVAESWNLIRHLADYVLVWKDDLGKSPHMARIGNSVYSNLCPNDPTCAHFGFMGDYNKPSPMMEKSLLYNLIQNGVDPKVKINPNHFKLVYTSKYHLVKIYQVQNISKESKAWIAEPNNRICDAPGSWYCVGQYPPAEPIQKLLQRRKNFKQLEDFNKGVNEKAAADSAKYHEQYMAKMAERERTGQRTA